MSNHLESEANLTAELIKLRREIIALKRAIEARDLVIRAINEDLNRICRKISHGCTDANCKECDR